MLKLIGNKRLISLLLFAVKDRIYNLTSERRIIMINVISVTNVEKVLKEKDYWIIT